MSVTNQEEKAELNQYREAEAEAARLEREICRWRSKAEKVTTAVKLLPGGSGAENAVEDAVLKIDELTVQLSEQRRETVRLRRKIEEAIAFVEDWKLRQLLRYRYIDGMKWEQIEAQMNYEKTQVWRLHGQALSALMMG